MKRLLLLCLVIVISTATYKIYYSPQTTKQYLQAPDESIQNNSYSIHKTPTKDLYITEPTENEQLEVQHRLIKKKENQLTETGKNKNLLLIGSDTRYEDDRGRADTIIYAQYSPNNKSVKFISFMRDSYVDIPGYGKNKLNAAYMHGGAPLLAETISNNFPVVIDQTIQVDFNGFQNLVTLVAPDGLEVDVPEELAAELNIDSGIQRLQAKYLLEFVRFRNTPESDFGRVKRQQQFIQQVKKEAIHEFSSIKGMIKLPQLIRQSSKYVETNLTTADLLNMAFTYMLHPVEELETLTIPITNDGFTDQYYEHAGRVLELNYEKNITEILNFLNPKEEIVASECNAEKGL
ncbi:MULTISPECIES: LCP family protein [Bacillus]|uniref:LCP family protein n=1 Tax=Bacillus TaxID=1386 RepID=UPI0012FEBC24|nr:MULTISPECIES: LCP family protein [Bacillus]